MTDTPIALLLPGQGSQFAGMALESYREGKRFARVIDDFFDLMGEQGHQPKRHWLSGDADLDDGRIAQPLIFALAYAFADTVIANGVEVAAVLGHSIGELAAATVAGVFDLPAAARIVAARCHALDRSPPGAMFAVAAGVDAVLADLRPSWVRAGVAIAAVNSPVRTIVSGPYPQVRATESALTRRGVVTRWLRAKQPWHSPCMAAVASEFERAVAAEPLGEPKIALWSGRTGGRVGAAEARPQFWAEQIATPVLYWAALSDLLADRDYRLVDTGPGTTLSVLARSHPRVRTGSSAVLGPDTVLSVSGGSPAGRRVAP
ncbi:acyltransferase domain-containing protein [Nocardia jinanensis]|uniref:Malonyl-CoA:ACP transacylase (MAT) domain-containing protein n=1 Tax=Nocardia jinanensis TaxID=382504 RepID=A0A917S186_9NOCA|nr:acyltransferase domain-containing protein [Nocardia jinanensis]GGL46421.1 hypothetical protein GCM10011588_71530 [Nocardia jinanensis]